MLRHHRLFGRLAADFTAAILLNGSATGLVGQAVAGEPWIDA